jgi:hypothetical protein
MPPPWRVRSSNRLHWNMNDTVSLHQSPPTWWLEPTIMSDRPADTTGDILRLGSQAVPLEGIVSYRLEEVIERDLEGRLLIGALTFVGVLGFGWLECFLAGFVVLSGVVIATLAEIFGVTSRRRFRISVFSENARPITYTSGDNRDIARLLKFLDNAIGR